MASSRLLHPALLSSLLLLVLTFGQGSYAAHWSYTGETGPYNWRNLDLSPQNNECGGKYQSPVDINERYTDYDRFLGPLRFNNYHTALKRPIIVNNGHTVMVQGTPERELYVEGSYLNGKYQFAQLHFHWGANSSRGSEHTFSGTQYPMEMHLVHFNQEYGNAIEAVKYRDGFLVVAVLFEITRNNNPNFQTIVDALSRVRTEDTNGVELPNPVVLNDLLPPISSHYYRYNGSLTTPPCSQAVIFNILINTVGISEQQMEQFRQLRAGAEESAELLVDNFRPALPLNGRQVFRSFPSAGAPLFRGTEGATSPNGFEIDLYDALADGGFNGAFQDILVAGVPAQQAGALVNDCNYYRTLSSWRNYIPLCDPVWRGVSDIEQLTSAQLPYLVSSIVQNAPPYQYDQYKKKKK